MSEMLYCAGRMDEKLQPMPETPSFLGEELWDRTSEPESVESVLYKHKEVSFGFSVSMQKLGTRTGAQTQQHDQRIPRAH